MIELDGAAGEGGGQILRTALALSMCTGQAMSLRRIRAGRARPGLMRQHLACVNAAVAISASKVDGAELGSQALSFAPGAPRPGDYIFNVGTAGSCSLVLQTVLPPLMMASGESRLILGGGTHNPMAPPFQFLERCFAPLLRRLGVGLTLELRRLGFYPAGGGEFIATITPVAGGLRPVDVMKRGVLREAYAECLTPGLPHRVAARELETVSRALGWSADQLRAPAVRENEGPGNALMLTRVHEHATEVVTAFGAKGVSAEAVASSAVRELQAFEVGEGALGPHLADQWMLPLALAVVHRRTRASFTCTEMTGHSKTNLEVISAFLPIRFEVVEVGPVSYRVSIDAA